MSNETQKPPTPVAAVPATEALPVQKAGFLTRTKLFVKDHKRPAIAVGLLVGLVGGAALLGRKTAPTAELHFHELEAPDEESEVEETVDTTVA